MPFLSWLLHEIGQKTKLCPKKTLWWDHLFRTNDGSGSDGKPLFHLVKELYVELDSTNFGKLISKFERCLLPCDFDLLKGFFEERMMSTCKRFTLKAIEECNKN